MVTRIVKVSESVEECEDCVPDDDGEVCVRSTIDCGKLSRGGSGDGMAVASASWIAADATTDPDAVALRLMPRVGLQMSPPTVGSVTEKATMGVSVL